MAKQISLESDLDLSSLKKFVNEEVIPHANRRDMSENFPVDLYQKLHTMGWMQASIPKRHGGPELSTLDLATLSRELAYGSCGVMLSTMVNLLSNTALSLYGSASLQTKLFPELLRRFSFWSFAMTEPNAGTDVARTETRATPVRGGYEISGQKCFITNANFADHLIVFAQLNSNVSESSKSNLSAFYIPAGIPGVSRGKAIVKLGQKESNTSELYFEKVFIPEENLLGKAGDGLKILFHCIHRSKTLIAAAGVGACERAFELATQHLNQRIHYGKPLLTQPTISSLLAQLKTEVEAAWLLTCRAASVWDTGDFAVKEASMAKLYSADVSMKVVTEILELFGGYGYMAEYEIERIFRDVRALEIFEGATFVQQLLIAKEIFPELRDTPKLREVHKKAG